MSAASVFPRVKRYRKWDAVFLLLIALLQDVISTADVTTTLHLRKCYCDKFQAWDGNQCRDASPIPLPIYLKEADSSKNLVIDVNNSVAIPTSTIKNVTVGELQCSEGFFPHTLVEEIILLPDGRLLWLKTNNILDQETFCVVQFWEDGQTFFDAQVCLPPAAVPRCCPTDHLLGRDGSCYPIEAVKTPPLLHLGKHEVDWHRVGGEMVSITCGEREYHHHVLLEPGKGQLLNTMPTATLVWNSPVWVSSQTWSNRFCAALQEGKDGELQYVAQICLKDYSTYHQYQCRNEACVRKCCPQNALLFQGVCAEALSEEEVWQPSRLPNQTINEEWKIVTGEPGCNIYDHTGQMHLLPNGSLQVDPEKPAVPPSRYCLDNLLDKENNIKNFAMLCFPEKNLLCLWRDILIKVMLGLSVVFLTATMAVYLGVSELRDHMYGRCLVSLVAAMLTAYLCIMIGPEQTDSTASCFAMAFINHMSGLAVFFWLNVMCFDMWKILRGSTRQQNSMKTFLGYSLYAWGCPLVVSVVALVLDAAHPENAILPQYNAGSCWFKDNAAYWLYFSGFILVLVLINVGFFIHVAITLSKKIKQRTKNFETSTSHTNKATKTKQQVWLFVKLFLVMGVVWITDALSAVSHRKTCSYWLVTDIINALQGVFIFIVAVCNKDNLKKVKDAWRPRVKVMRRTLSNIRGQTSRRPTQTVTLSSDDAETSRKTSVTSLPRKISQASNILFSSSKKSATLNPPDSSTNPHGGRKGSNVSIKDVIPLSNMRD